jgi:hypothetical protein
MTFVLCTGHIGAAVDRFVWEQSSLGHSYFRHRSGWLPGTRSSTMR